MFKVFTSLLTCLLISLVTGWSILAQAPAGYQKTPRIKLSLNQGWKFKLGEPTADYFKEDFQDAQWPTVHVPHTLELADLNLNGYTDDKTQLTFHRNVGWYRKSILVDKSNRKVFLEFEGAHQVTDLWVNGKHVGQHSVGGYTPFHFDITDYVRKGVQNQITLLVDNRRRADVPPDPGPFDYIKFSGLYRDVYQVETNPTYVTFNWEAMEAGVAFTTPSVDPVNMNATVDVKTVVRNETGQNQNITLVNRLVDKNGLVVLRMDGNQNVEPGQDARFSQIGGIEDDLHLWSVDDPYLYRLVTSVYHESKLLDQIECKVGIRKFEHHPREGFLLNGQPIKLIGANRHQHYGYLGDAMPNSLHRKDMLQFKALGFNVVRTAHYPQDNALVEACDELGILVYEEAPTWISIGNEAWFENLEKAARTMVRNHRNHPSVIIWGGGINHRGYVPQVHLAVKQEDPTRLTASQSSRWTGWQTSGMTDIYGQMIYGPVEWYRHEPMLAMEGREGIENLARYKKDPLLTGIISWNAHDYYTFHPISKPTRDRDGGLMTIFRHPYGPAPWYPAELTSAPYLHFASTWEEGVSEVVVYSNTDEIELLVNGKPMGRKKVDKSGLMGALNSPPFKFNIDKYQPGKLTARGWTDDQVLIEKTIATPQKAVAVKLVVDNADRQFVADGSDIMQAYAYIVDENGTVLENENRSISFDVKGVGSIVGDGQDIGANPRTMVRGHAPVLIRASTLAGEMVVTASAKGLKSDKVSLVTTSFDPDANAAVQGFADMEVARVDLGSSDQLVQFGWEAWNQNDGEEASYQCNKVGGFKASIQCNSEDGLLRWLGEMNVMGKYGYAHGEGVLGVDEKGIQLKIEGLAQGQYELVTYHHAPRSNTDSMDPNKEKLKTLNVTKIGYAKTIGAEWASGNDKIKKQAVISEGNILPSFGPASLSFKFEKDDGSPITITFKDREGNNAVWLNAFELKKIIK